MAAAARQPLVTTDPLGGDVAARADAYSTYLAYWGTYELRDDDAIVHRIDESLFPNWSGEEQIRSYTCEDDRLVLRTPPMQVSGGATVVNELAWIREVG
jgi:hypothetical protein